MKHFVRFFNDSLLVLLLLVFCFVFIIPSPALLSQSTPLANGNDKYLDGNGLTYKDIVILNHGHGAGGSIEGMLDTLDAVKDHRFDTGPILPRIDSTKYHYGFLALDDKYYTHFRGGKEDNSSKYLDKCDKYEYKYLYGKGEGESHRYDGKISQTGCIVNKLDDGMYYQEDDIYSADGEISYNDDTSNLNERLYNDDGTIYEALLVGHSGGGVRSLAYAMDQRLNRSSKYFVGRYGNKWDGANMWDRSPLARGIIAYGSPLRGAMVAEKSLNEINKLIYDKYLHNFVISCPLALGVTLHFLSSFFVNTNVTNYVLMTLVSLLGVSSFPVDKYLAKPFLVEDKIKSNTKDLYGSLVGTHDLKPSSKFMKEYIDPNRVVGDVLYKVCDGDDCYFVRYTPKSLPSSEIPSFEDIEDLADITLDIMNMQEELDNILDSIAGLLKDMNNYTRFYDKIKFLKDNLYYKNGDDEDVKIGSFQENIEEVESLIRASDLIPTLGNKIRLIKWHRRMLDSVYRRLRSKEDSSFSTEDLCKIYAYLDDIKGIIGNYSEELSKLDKDINKSLFTMTLSDKFRSFCFKQILNIINVYNSRPLFYYEIIDIGNPEIPPYVGNTPSIPGTGNTIPPGPRRIEATSGYLIPLIDDLGLNNLIVNVLGLLKDGKTTNYWVSRINDSFSGKTLFYEKIKDLNVVLNHCLSNNNTDPGITLEGKFVKPLEDVYYASISGGCNDFFAMSDMTNLSLTLKNLSLCFNIIALEDLLVSTILFTTSVPLSSIFIYGLVGVTMDPILILYSSLAYRDLSRNYDLVGYPVTDSFINANSTIYPAELLGGRPISNEDIEYDDEFQSILDNEFRGVDVKCHYHYPELVHGGNEKGLNTSKDVMRKVEYLKDRYLDNIKRERNEEDH